MAHGAGMQGGLLHGASNGGGKCKPPPWRASPADLMRHLCDAGHFEPLAPPSLLPDPDAPTFPRLLAHLRAVIAQRRTRRAHSAAPRASTLRLDGSLRAEEAIAYHSEGPRYVLCWISHWREVNRRTDCHGITT